MHVKKVEYLSIDIISAYIQRIAGHPLISKQTVVTSHIVSRRSPNLWSPNCLGISTQWISKEERPGRLRAEARMAPSQPVPNPASLVSIHRGTNLHQAPLWTADGRYILDRRKMSGLQLAVAIVNVVVSSASANGYPVYVSKGHHTKSLHLYSPYHRVALGISIGSRNSKKWAIFWDVEWWLNILNDSHNMYIYIYTIYVDSLPYQSWFCCLLSPPVIIPAPESPRRSPRRSRRNLPAKIAPFGTWMWCLYPLVN